MPSLSNQNSQGEGRNQQSWVCDNVLTYRKQLRDKVFIDFSDKLNYAIWSFDARRQATVFGMKAVSGCRNSCSVCPALLTKPWGRICELVTVEPDDSQFQFFTQPKKRKLASSDPMSKFVHNNDVPENHLIMFLSTAEL